MTLTCTYEYNAELLPAVRIVFYLLYKATNCRNPVPSTGESNPQRTGDTCAAGLAPISWLTGPLVFFSFYFSFFNCHFLPILVSSIQLSVAPPLDMWVYGWMMYIVSTYRHHFGLVSNGCVMYIFIFSRLLLLLLLHVGLSLKKESYVLRNA